MARWQWATLWLIAVLAIPSPAFADAEPPIVKATLDAIATTTGVRPSHQGAVVAADGTVTLRRLTIRVPNRFEPDDINETVIDAVTLAGVTPKADGFRVDKATFSGMTHRAAAFSMEVLQIDALYSELGIDPPGSLGRARDERVEISNLVIDNWTIDPTRLASPDALQEILFGGDRFSVDALAYASQGEAPLVVRGIVIEEARKRSAGETWRYRIDRVELTEPWLATLAGTVFAELGYAALPVSVDAETFRHGGRATGRAVARAPGAFNLVVDYALGGLAAGTAVAPSPVAILAHSPDAGIETARFVLVEAGMARRAMTLLARQSGASPEAIASALGQQAGSALRRAGYARIAAETATAVSRFLVDLTHIAIAVPAGPLARFAAMGGAQAPAALEAAGLTVEAKD